MKHDSDNHFIDHTRNISSKRNTHPECGWGSVHCRICGRDRMYGDHYLDFEETF